MIAIRLMPERQCAGCTKQDEWGCTAKQWRPYQPDEVEKSDAWINPAYLPITLDDEEIYSCPRQSIYENAHEWTRVLKLYGFYKAGFLPEAGGVIDQSNKLMSVFRVFDEANAECDQQEREQRSNKGGKATKRRGK